LPDRNAHWCASDCASDQAIALPIQHTRVRNDEFLGTTYMWASE